MARKKSTKADNVTAISKNNPPDAQSDAPSATRGQRRGSSPSKPSAAEVASEAASIYPDTFDTPPSPDEIAAEAYAIYKTRGGSHGAHNDDWLEAERRLLERRRKTSR